MLPMRQNQHRFLRIILLVLGAVSATSAASAAPTKAQPSAVDTYKEGLGLLEKSKFKEAVEVLRRADELAEGKCGPCQLGLARAFTGLSQPEKAAGAARQAVAELQSPDLQSQAWNHLGLALASQRKPDLAGAEQALRKAVEIGGQVVNISRYNLADVLWRQKKFAESEKLAREALSADPFGPASRNARIVLCQARADGAPPIPPEVLYEEAACNLETMRPADTVDRDRAAGKEVLPPVKLFGNPPSYDEQARADHVEGVVVVESIIDKEGCIQKLRLCKSVHPALDSAAMAAVRRWVFQPATLENDPVKVYYTLTVNFQVGSRPGPG